MNRDDVIRLAREAGAEILCDRIVISPGALWAMLNGAEHDGAEAEREACEGIAAEYGRSRPIATPNPSPTIVGRWEGEQAASQGIAAAIRARKDAQ